MSRVRRSRGQSGLTLVELLVSIAVTGIIIGPVSGWAFALLNQQKAVKEQSFETIGASLLSTYFPRDVSGANQAWTSSGVTPNGDPGGSDCPGMDPSTGGGGTVLASLISFDATAPLRIVYSSVPSGVTVSLWRRVCAFTTPAPTSTIASTRIARNLSSASAGCLGSVPDACRRVRIAITPLGGSTAELVSTRRLSGVTQLPTNRPPNAVPTVTRTSGAQPLSVTFDDSGSTDSNGTIVSYQWEFPGGTPATSVRTTPGTVNVTFPFPPGPTPVFTTSASLTVVDDGGATDTRYVVISVLNNLPTISIGGLRPSVSKGESVTLTAGAVDPDARGPLTYLWQFGAGATPISSTAESPTISWNAVGDRPITLTVTDADGGTATIAASQRVVNRPPRAIITQPPVDGRSFVKGVAVTFDASTSTDVDGTVVGYQWDDGQGGGFVAGAAVVTRTFTSAGSFTVRVKVIDDNGDAGITQRRVSIVDGFPPTAVIVPPPFVPLNSPVTFTAVVNDPDGTVVDYLWTFGPGSSPATSTQAAPSVSFSAAGAQTISLRVTDNSGNPTTVTTVITPGNRLPVAVFTRSPDPAIDTTVLTFDASGSSDPDGTIASFDWILQYGNGSAFDSATGNPLVRTLTPGRYQVAVRVTDNNGASASTAVQNFAVTGRLPTPTNLRRTGPGDYAFDPLWGADSYEIEYRVLGFFCSATDVQVLNAPTSTGTVVNGCAGASGTTVRVRALSVGPGVAPSDWSATVEL